MIELRGGLNQLPPLDECLTRPSSQGDGYSEEVLRALRGSAGATHWCTGGLPFGTRHSPSQSSEPAISGSFTPRAWPIWAT